VIVRATEERDLGVLVKLMTELGYPTSVEEMNRRLEEISADPSYCTLGAETEGQVLGAAGLHAVILLRSVGDMVAGAVQNGQGQ
jgi:hypothetical protein